MSTITESFNKANNGLGPDLAWTVYFGTAANVGVTNNQANAQGTGETESRADSDLASDDHYVQAVVGADYAVGFVGVLCRKDSTATRTLYRWSKFVPGSGAWELAKFVGGSETILSSAYSSTLAAGQSFKMDANGSTIRGFHLGTQRVSVTDAAITGNLRCGIHLGDSTAAYIDSFEAGDLAGGGGAPAIGSLGLLGVGL